MLICWMEKLLGRRSPDCRRARGATDVRTRLYAECMSRGACAAEFSGVFCRIMLHGIRKSLGATVWHSRLTGLRAGGRSHRASWATKASASGVRMDSVAGCGVPLTATPARSTAPIGRKSVWMSLEYQWRSVTSVSRLHDLLPPFPGLLWAAACRPAQLPSSAGVTAVVVKPRQHLSHTGLITEGASTHANSEAITFAGDSVYAV